jgi:hypothetical protein
LTKQVSDKIKIPMFPLTIFPLPGELVPLHIFEPRYRQLLQDAETRDLSFGIYFNHVQNEEKLGSVVKLESVIKRYPGGEADVIVKCTDLLKLHTLFRTFKDKMYPGAEVSLLNVDTTSPVNDKVESEFLEYLLLLKINQGVRQISVYTIALELNLSFEDRLKFVRLELVKQESFLQSRMRYLGALLKEAEKARNVFHLN